MKIKQFTNFLEQLSIKDVLVIDKLISKNNYVAIDISKNNLELKTFDVSSAAEWEKYITSYLKKNNAKVAFGGYLEVRNLYDRSSHFKSQSKEKLRNIHLGIDLWCTKNTKVLAVLDGEIHSFKNNNNYGDYGPTIILKHQIKNNVFYSLYGHLSLKSIKNIKIGDHFKQGEVIGFLGNSSINGEYAPHLHFQIIKDLEDNLGDYPGVSSKENLDFYKENCPNPNILLKL